MMVITSRFLETTILLEVDLAILEYLIYNATSALLQDHTTPATTRSLEMFDAFLHIFRANHPEHHDSSILQLQLRLLRFTTSFCRRLRPYPTSLSESSLARERANRRRRLEVFSTDQDISCILKGEAFVAFDNFTPVPSVVNNRYKASVFAASNDVVDFDSDYGKPNSLSLLDTLFPYMALCGAFTQLRNGQVTRPWMLLTAQYMLGAVQEQYLAFGSTGREVIAEAFAYGLNYRLSENVEQEMNDDELLIKSMFRGDQSDQAENGGVRDWREIRSTHISILIPPKGTTLSEHLENIAAKDFSIHTLQPAILDFLKHMLQAQPQPLLLQVEQGNIEGLNNEQSKAFLQTVLMKQ